MTPHAIQSELEDARMELAVMEADAHIAKVTGFIDDNSKTVKEKEYVAEYAALRIHRDLLIQRAKVRSLEDRLKVALNAGPVAHDDI